MDEEGNPLYGDVFGLTMEPDEDELVRQKAFALQAKPCISPSLEHLQYLLECIVCDDTLCMTCYLVHQTSCSWAMEPERHQAGIV